MLGLPQWSGEGRESLPVQTLNTETRGLLLRLLVRKGEDGLRRRRRNGGILIRGVV